MALQTADDRLHKITRSLAQGGDGMHWELENSEHNPAVVEVRRHKGKAASSAQVVAYER